MAVIRFKRTNLARLSDNELAWLYADTRNREYFAELFLRYLPLSYGVCLGRSDDVEQAASAIREAYASLEERFVPDAANCSDFRGWLYGALGEILPAGEDQPHESTVNVSPQASQLAAWLARGEADIEEYLSNSTVKLSRSEKECIRMFYGHKMSFQEVASHEGFLVGDVRKYIIKALEALAGAEQQVNP